MYYAICYVSTSDQSLSKNDLEELFNYTANKNNQSGISGILLHNDGNFLQYFEGEESQIKELYYSKIMQDVRHKNVMTLFESKISNQYFQGYEAGFTSVLQKNNTPKLRAYINLLKHLNSKEIEVLSNTVNSFLS